MKIYCGLDLCFYICIANTFEKHIKITLFKKKHQMKNIKSFTTLQDLLGKEQAAAVAQYVEENTDNSELATKNDLNLLRKDIDLVRKDIDLVKIELKKDFEMGFKEQLKWLIILMFGFSSLIIAVIKLL